MKKIGIIGAGTMGSGIAHCFAQHKFEICLFSVTQVNDEELYKSEFYQSDMDTQSG